MEVITIESETFKQMLEMFSTVAELAKLEKSAYLRSTIEMLSAKEVAKLTKFSVETITSRKEEIGYFTLGKNLRFKPADVEAWINRNYRQSKYIRGSHLHYE